MSVPPHYRGHGSASGVRALYRAGIVGFAIIAIVQASCSNEGGDDSADATDTSSKSTGVGKACAGNNDCKPHGLTCYVLDPTAGSGICSKPCERQDDCSGGTRCNPVNSSLVCSPPQLCDPCASGDDCGPTAPICVQGEGSKAGFCSLACNVGDGKCPSGYSCKQYGTKAEEFACTHDYGSCDGAGDHCSPCKTDSDCTEGTACFQSKPRAERFCAKTCDVGSNPDGCPTGFKCASYGGKGYCYKSLTVQGPAGPQEKLFPTCIAGTKGFCDACEDDWQCASGRCVTKNEKKFCAQKGSCTVATQAEDCPYGGKATFCVTAGGSNVCAPPLLYKCHGYKACLSHPCNGDERCDDGICVKK